MEGVAKKVRRDLSWDTRIRANKHTPPFHPSRRIGREINNELGPIIIPTTEQLREDTTWKE